MVPDAVVNGKASGGIRFFRRSSAGSIPSSVASRSIARSTSAVASGRPAPRYGATGVAFVTTLRPLHAIAGKR